MIWTDFRKALAQLGDPRFLRVAVLGIALALVLLIAIAALFVGLIDRANPGSVDLPFLGPMGGLNAVLSWATVLLMLVLSVFLMVPVASAFSGLFLDDVASAVEDRHYPRLPPVPRQVFADSLVDTANFIGLLILVNGLCLFLYAIALPFSPFIFWAANGFMLGREYFTLVATRRLGRQGAKLLRGRYWVQVWLAGCLMAAPLSIPLINLIIPVLGVATFTHMFHRLSDSAATVTRST